MSDWTPTKDAIRNAWSYFRAFTNGPGKYLVEFDRWLEQHDREVAEQAWDEGYRTCNQAWVDTADIVTPDEDRIDPTNPYSNRRH